MRTGRTSQLLLLLLGLALVVASQARALENHDDRTSDPLQPGHLPIGELEKLLREEYLRRVRHKSQQHPIHVPLREEDMIRGAPDVMQDNMRALRSAHVQDTAMSPRTETMDPVLAFCAQACMVGMGGRGCNCPDHPIGKRSLPHSMQPPHRRPFRRAPPPPLLAKNHDEHIREETAAPIAATETQTEASTTVGTLSSTTKDPVLAFCEQACREGLGGVACDCPDHPIG